MDNQRILLWAALGFLLLQVWSSWQQDYNPRMAVPNTVDNQQPDATRSIDQTGGQTSSENTGAIAPSDAPSDDLPAPVTSEQAAVVPDTTADGAPAGEEITVTTDTFRVAISSKGGDINSVRLLQYPTSLETPDDPFVLMNNTEEEYFVAQSGLQSSGGSAIRRRNHRHQDLHL